MPKVALNDTNILIDFYKIDLLDALLEIDLEMHTTDFVVAELVVEEQLDWLEELIEQRKLIVSGFSGEEIFELMQKESDNLGLSLTDCSAWQWAEKNQGILLTGDAQLRQAAIKSGVEVHGSIWLMDELLRQGILTEAQGCKAIKKLRKKNRRLPKRELDKREKLWCVDA
jgi:predicted nucleic acid-binding protein